MTFPRLARNEILILGPCPFPVPGLGSKGWAGTWATLLEPGLGSKGWAGTWAGFQGLGWNLG
jgi:hypothetical protein